MNEPDYVAILAVILAGKAIREQREHIFPDVDAYSVAPFYIELAKYFVEAVEDSL